MNARLGAAVVAAAVALSGCGSTVMQGAAGSSPGSEPALSSSDGLGAAGGQGLTAPADSGIPAGQAGAAPGTASAPVAAGTTGQVLGGAVVGGAPGASGGTGGSAGTAGAGAAPPRTDASPAQVGFAITQNNSAAASSLGFSGINNGDEKQVVQALVAAANASGGLAGRRVVPVFFELDPSTSESSDEIGQRQCAAFTEDAQVVAVSAIAVAPTLASCLAKRSVVGIAGNPQQAFSQAELRALPSIATFGLTPRSQAAAIVEAAARQDYLKDRPRVGIVTIDSTRFRDAATKTMLPALRAKGAQIDADDIFYGPELKRTADLSALATAMQSAVLRMSSRGVTHVVFLQDAAAAALIFMQQADSQNATFRYALSSTDAPGFIAANGAPARQLRGAVAAGWDPYLDVPASKAGPPPAGRAWCKQAFSKVELTPGSNAEWIAFMHCDAFRLLLLAAQKASGGVSTSSLVAGLNQVGDVPSANVPAARISSDHRWATAGYRINRYDEACGCFSYLTTTVQPV